jgi:hypothetical protein
MFVVLEPGITPRAASSSVPRLTVEVALAPGQLQALDLEVSEEAIAQVIDAVYRIGGDELLWDLVDAIAATRDTPGKSGLPDRALDLCWSAIVQLRQDAYAGLIAVDGAARLAFEEALTEARAALKLSNFGLIEDSNQHAPPVSKVKGAPETYRALRNTVVVLDEKYGNLRRWNFTIPENAPTARRQFEQTAYQPYVEAIRAAGQQWPALQAYARVILPKLHDRPRSTVERWAKQQDGTPLDDIIKQTFNEAWLNLIDEQPDFFDDMLNTSQWSIRHTSLRLEARPDLAPEKNFGDLNPLWRHPFLIQKGLEKLGLQPGDLAYAAALGALRVAEKAAAAERKKAADTARMLGWASIGFGVLALIPVVGQFALVAAIAVNATMAFSDGIEYLNDQERYQAVGPLADRFGFAEPEAAGLIIDVLGLVSDVGLPVLGKLINAGLQPAGRLLAAARVNKVLEVGSVTADLAGLAVQANAALLEKEMNRLGLTGLKAGQP